MQLARHFFAGHLTADLPYGSGEAAAGNEHVQRRNSLGALLSAREPPGRPRAVALKAIKPLVAIRPASIAEYYVAMLKRWRLPAISYQTFFTICKFGVGTGMQ